VNETEAGSENVESKSEDGICWFTQQKKRNCEMRKKKGT
jgi:hypothetical protein